MRLSRPDSLRRAVADRLAGRRRRGSAGCGLARHDRVGRRARRQGRRRRARCRAARGRSGSPGRGGCRRSWRAKRARSGRRSARPGRRELLRVQRVAGSSAQARWLMTSSTPRTFEAPIGRPTSIASASVKPSRFMPVSTWSAAGPAAGRRPMRGRSLGVVQHGPQICARNSSAASGKKPSST